MMEIDVVLNLRVPADQLHSDDVDLTPADDGSPMRFPMSVPDDVPEEHWANAALDIFHSTIPVKVPDDFNFSVECSGKELYEADDCEPGRYC